ncbi:uncharacterized protein LOC108860497 isoform X1 [Raphanus sativus]|uniref:Uncharacterized protein LOC108860497 isoform X1 n=1 Tax=Raphanus sativus TaxID=3726 RepID=A0A9W3BSX6_RAPSA|nr:uncharacterized protein LOC108860497 isoform X1 [Raphanus sativus]
MEEQIGGSEDRWKGSLQNITEMASNLDALQKLLLKKAVFVEEDTFARASLISEQSRTIKVLDQRVQTLERELDAAITAAAHARSEKRQAESSQKAAESRAQEVTKELENTTSLGVRFSVRFRFGFFGFRFFGSRNIGTVRLYMKFGSDPVRFFSVSVRFG